VAGALVPGLLLATCALAAPEPSVTLAAPAVATPSAVAGRVLAAAEPLAEASVYAYQVVEKSLRRALTDQGGRFRFGDLPEGLYKIVAHKPGYLPAVAVVAHKSEEETPFVEVELAPRDAPLVAEDFWTLRAEIPGDVLREMEAPLAIEMAALTAAPRPHAEFLAQMSAAAGIERVAPEATAHVTTGSVGLAGEVGGLQVRLEGDYQTLDSGLVDWTQDGAEGRSSALRLNVQGARQGRFDLATMSHRSLTVVDGDSYPVDFARYQVGWRSPLGNAATTGFSAQYVEESGLYTKGWADPVTLPQASRALRVEGSYATELTERTRLRTGISYREWSADYLRTRAVPELGEGLRQESFDVYGIGDWELHPVVVVQYGLYTTLRDGTLSLTPRGGILLHLGTSWQASVLASRRLATNGYDATGAEFAPTLLEQTLACEDSELSCYQLQVTHGAGDGDEVVVGASLRELDRTVRLFFSDEFFARSEGLFLVPGDRLPEVHASVRKRITPNVVTRVSSNYASGGGGAFLAQNRRVYENEVAYLSGAVETTFERTSTGLYVALHRLDQRLEPVWRPTSRFRQTAEEVSLDRVEVVVSQDLAPLFEFAADWAVHLGMEVSRGATLFQADPENRDVLRHRVLTGFAVRF
jgi:hypothetical protein